jgi:hypothetical protein
VSLVGAGYGEEIDKATPLPPVVQANLFIKPDQLEQATVSNECELLVPTMPDKQSQCLKDIRNSKQCKRHPVK